MHRPIWSSARTAATSERRCAEAPHSRSRARTRARRGTRAARRTPRAREGSFEEILINVIREGCIGETVAAVEAAEALEHAVDPMVRDALARIAKDELRHADLAWQFVRWALDRGGRNLSDRWRDESSRLRGGLDPGRGRFLRRTRMRPVSSQAGSFRGPEARSPRSNGRARGPGLRACASRFSVALLAS